MVGKWLAMILIVTKADVFCLLRYFDLYIDYILFVENRQKVIFTPRRGLKDTCNISRFLQPLMCKIERIWL